MPDDKVQPHNGVARTASLHWGGFLASGLVALTIDAAVLEAGIGLIHLHPLMARMLAISCAMVAGWLCHRTMTFALQSQPTLKEFLGYAAVAWTTAAINYATFAAILIVRPATQPLLALFFSSIVAAAFSYVGMRFGAFRGRR